MKKKKIALSLLTIAVCMATLSILGTSYSWIKRDWAPSITKDNMLIETSGSLAIQLENDEEEYSTGLINDIYLNDQLGLGDFKLRQVSNGTGLSDNFFTIDYSDGEALEKLEYITANDGSDTYLNHSSKHGYIEVRFQLVSKSKTKEGSQLRKYVFIDSYESYIKSTAVGGCDVSEAIRVGITIEGNSSTTTDTNYLFKKSDGTHIGATGAVNDNGVKIANGLNIYKYIKTLVSKDKDGDTYSYAYDLDGNGNKQYNETAYIENSDVHTFADYNGGMQSEDIKDFTVSQFTATKSLFSLSYIETRTVRVRIWLEGYDANCVDEIAGSEINFRLVFRSFDIEDQSQQS